MCTFRKQTPLALLLWLCWPGCGSSGFILVIFLQPQGRTVHSATPRHFCCSHLPSHQSHRPNSHSAYTFTCLIWETKKQMASALYAGSLPNVHTMAEVRSQELHVGVPTGGRDPSHLGYPKGHSSRRLEAQQKLKPKHSNTYSNRWLNLPQIASYFYFFSSSWRDRGSKVTNWSQTTKCFPVRGRIRFCLCFSCPTCSIQRSVNASRWRPTTYQSLKSRRWQMATHEPAGFL